MKTRPTRAHAGTENELLKRIEEVRRFNRFYTQKIGVLQEGLLHTPYSLTEARIIYELAHREQTTAAELSQELGVDEGYLSRILRAFQKQGLIAKKVSQKDGRQLLIQLTECGQEAFSILNASSRKEIGAMLGELSEEDQKRLVRDMGAIEKLLGAPEEHKVPYILRHHQPGDMGWVVQRHAELYNQEYGWDEQFEGLVAEIVARFIQKFDPKRERCWIAEKNGQNAGCVFLVKRSERVAQLRLLLVEPSARGLGIGRRLVQECTRFARRTAYRKIMLWTNSVLHAACHIYEQEGYHLVKEEKHHSFGHDLVGQNWELEL